MRIYGHINSPSLVHAPAGIFFLQKNSPWLTCAQQFLFSGKLSCQGYNLTKKDAQHNLEPDKPILSPRSQFSTHFVKKTYFDITRCFRATRAGPLHVSNCRPKVLVRVSCA